MFIRVNIKPVPGPCAYVYAWPDDGEAFHHLVFKFMHTHMTESSMPHTMPFSRDDDLYLTFKSNVNFEEWNRKVLHSDFNDPKRYRLLTHNCAYATLFALESAGIKLLPKQRYVIFNRLVYPMGITLRIPLFILTPHDIYALAKEYKLKQLQASDRETHYRVIKSKILFWIITVPKKEHASLEQEKKLVSKIIDEVEERHKKRSELTEEQIDVLIQTYRLVTQLPSKEKCKDYSLAAEQFKKRSITNTARIRDIIISLFIFSLGGFAGQVLGLTYQYSSEKLSFGESNAFRDNQNFLLASASILAASAFTLFGTKRKIPSIFNSPRSQIEPTELSQNMCELARLRGSVGV